MKPIRMIQATSPEDLVAEVNKALAGQEDLYTPLFASSEGLLCQRVTPMLCIYEYRLVTAEDLHDLNTQECNLMELGYDYIFGTVMWRGKYLQWMSRMNSSGLKVRDAVSIAHDEYIPAERSDELQLVEDVRAALHMAPAAEGTTLVSIPFPLRLS